MRGLLLLAGVALAAPLAAEAPPATVDTAVLVRALEKGEALSPADFTVEPLGVAQARGALGPEETAGMEAFRRLSAGAPVRRHDLIPVQLVRRGEPVLIAVRSAGLSITTQGRALSSGAKGDLVRVVSTSTSKTLDGVVDKAGSVRIAAP